MQVSHVPQIYFTLSNSQNIQFSMMLLLVTNEGVAFCSYCIADCLISTQTQVRLPAASSEEANPVFWEWTHWLDLSVWH